MPRANFKKGDGRGKMEENEKRGEEKIKEGQTGQPLGALKPRLFSLGPIIFLVF
jgi:hypothetical protein